MNESKRSTFDLSSTYVHLEDGGDAATIPIGPSFWPKLMAGDVTDEDVRRVGQAEGWLLAAFECRESMKHWEMHPAGDEVLILKSGEVDIVFDEPGGERVLTLLPGGVCVVPKGVWHQQRVRAPGEMIAVTYGKGTQHR